MSPQDSLDAILGLLAGWRAMPQRDRLDASAAETLAAARALAVAGMVDAPAALHCPLPGAVMDEAVGAFRLLAERLDGAESDAAMAVVDGAMRREAGAFHTPSRVAAALAECAGLTDEDFVLDPACGAGSLLRYASARAPRCRVVGLDVDPRSVVACRAALSGHRGPWRVSRADFLAGRCPGDRAPTVILVNPPYGAAGPGSPPREGLFVEACLAALAPGGRLWAVVPRGLLTNRGQDRLRRRVDAVAALSTVLELPPDTFAVAGARVATAAVELVKHGEPRRAARVRVRSVGHDAAGRPTGSEDVSRAAARRSALLSGLPGEPGDDTLPLGSGLAWLSEAPPSTSTLGSLCTSIACGPGRPRAGYGDVGRFAVKVGNLGRFGVDWTPRPRNHALAARAGDPDVAPGDVLITCAAHHPKYVGLKVVLVGCVPAWVNAPPTLSSEVMRLRADPSRIDPAALYLWLRSPEGYALLQGAVRGQSAHLYASDVAALPVDSAAVKRAYPSDLCHRARECVAAWDASQDRWRELDDVAKRLTSGD